LPYVLAKFGEVGFMHPWKPFVGRALPVELHGENVLNNQQLTGGLLDFAEI